MAGYGGLTSYSFEDPGVKWGLRGNVGGENATWMINPATGQEEPAFVGPGGFYLYSDIAKQFGNDPSKWPTGGLSEQGNPEQVFQTERWGGRPSDDSFTGKAGWGELATIAAMAAPVVAGAAGAYGATGAGAAGSTAGTAAFEGGAAGYGAGAGGTAAGAGAGGGLTASANTSSLLNSSIGTAGSTAGGIGGEALGTGLAVPGGLGTGLGAGPAGISGAAAAGTSLAPGYFAAEGLGGAGAGATGAGATGGGSGTATGGSALAGPAAGGTLEMLARGIPGALGALGAAKQSNDYKGLADDYMAVGAPARARFEASYAPGFSMENDPGYQDALKQAAKASLYGLSVNGNPAGSPNAWGQSLTDLYQKTAYQALQNYRNQNAAAGGMAALTQAAPGASNSAISAQGNVFNGLGAAANDIFNPPKTLTQLLREIQAAGR